MSFDLKRVLASKQAHRKRLAARPVAEKLALLDALRERMVTIRAATPSKNSSRAEPASLPNATRKRT